MSTVLRRSRKTPAARGERALPPRGLWPDPPRPIRNPGLSRQRLREIHRFLCLNRLMEDRLSALYRQGQIHGGLYSSLGQEGISVGTAYALAPDDLLAPMIRNIGSLLVRGVEPLTLFLQFLARADAPTGGKDGTLHFDDLERSIVGPISVLGTLIPVMTGAALAARMRGENRVALTYIGDGGTSTGDFHEGLNLAAVLNLPLILVVENNGYAYSTPTRAQFAVQRLAERGPAYGIASESIDGTDVLAVYAATRRAVERGRQGGGPTLLECRAFRRRGHAEHDDMRYVPKALLQAWEKRDPLDRFEEFLLDEGQATKKELRAIREGIVPALDEAARSALERPYPRPEETLRDVYHETE
jgi:TPP-dependent pyruvate/acetoin dehydrogenase alpha subunit